MCQPAVCRECGKTTWRGCGLHVDQVMAGVPKSQQCTCERVSGGIGSTLQRIFRG
jgi:hypothetical protein